VNIIRLPMNEDCWLGINGVKPEYAGNNYKNALSQFVDLLINNGFAVILDLHWTAPGGAPAKGQMPMPDADHSYIFWFEVATLFKNRTSVIFDVFNEPFPDNETWDSQNGWKCWKNGDNCNGIPYNVAGMQGLVDAIRITGANNIIMLGGLQYSNSLVQWLNYKPYDPTGNLIASWHSYNFNYCVNEACWNKYVAPVASQVPVIAGEIGENDCTSLYISRLMKWMDQQGVHYLGWTWNPWNCNDGPALIIDFSGNPTNFGRGLKDHLNRNQLFMYSTYVLE